VNRDNSHTDGYRLDDWSSIPGKGRNVSLRHHVQTGPGMYSVSCPFGTAVKRPKREADHSLPSSVDVKYD
jgi:hypothetical protein